MKLIYIYLFILIPIAFYFIFFTKQDVGLSGLPINLFVKSRFNEQVYKVDLSNLSKNNWALYVKATKVSAFSWLIINKNNTNNNYTINGYTLQKNWKEVSKLSFGNLISFTWYSDKYLIIHGQYYGNSPDVSEKILSQIAQLVIFDLDNRKEYWIDVLDAEKINTKISNVNIGEILWYLE